MVSDLSNPTANKMYLYRCIDTLNSFKRTEKALLILRQKIKTNSERIARHPNSFKSQNASSNLTFFNPEKHNRESTGSRSRYKKLEKLTIEELDVLIDHIEFVSRLSYLLNNSEKHIFAYIVSATLDLYLFMIKDEKDIY